MSEVQNQPLAPILGIRKDIEDPGSGAVAGYHVVAAYQVMLQHGGSSAVTFASYVSRATHEAGRNPLAHVTLPIKGAPTGDSALWPTWFAERVLAGDVVLQPGQTAHALDGGVAVRAGEPA
jgi:hypothetical protein